MEANNTKKIRCNICGCNLTTWDIRISKTLAYQYPVCESDIANEYDLDLNQLRSKMEHYFGMRPCLGL